MGKHHATYGLIGNDCTNFDTMYGYAHFISYENTFFSVLIMNVQLNEVFSSLGNALRALANRPV